MNVEEIQAAIERLKKENEESGLLDMIRAYMGGNEWQRIDFRDALVDVLEKAKSKWWVDKSGEEDLAKVSDSLLAEWGYMRMPKDRDGETIRPGDKVDFDGEAYEVRSIKAFIGRDSSYYLVIMGNHCEFCLNPNALRHHHEPTIKDVLREFEDKWNYVVDDGDENVTAALIIECAEKLREVMDA